MKKQKQIQQILLKKLWSVKYKISIFYLTFFLITITLLIVVSIYSYLIKHPVKQKHLLQFHVTNDKVISVL